MRMIDSARALDLPDKWLTSFGEMIVKRAR